MYDYIMICYVSALSGILFPGKEEASYSNFRLWEATGSVIAYAYSPYLCTYIKLYILLGLLLVGVTGYTAIEYNEYKMKNETDLKTDKCKFELVSNGTDLKTGEVAE